MRGSLAHAFRQGIHEAARGLEFEFYYHFFDAIFLANGAGLPWEPKRWIQCAKLLGDDQWRGPDQMDAVAAQQAAAVAAIAVALGVGTWLNSTLLGPAVSQLLPTFLLGARAAANACHSLVPGQHMHTVAAHTAQSRARAGSLSAPSS